MPEDNSVNRRKFLKTIGAAVGVTGLGSNVVGATDTRKVTKPWAVSSDGIEETIDVPEGWYNHFQKTKRVNQTISSALSRSPRVKNVATVRSSESINGISGFEIEVEVDKSVNGKLTIPNQKNGIQISTTEARQRSDLCANREEFSDVPGGIIVNEDLNSSNPYGGTSGWYAEVYNEPTIITAGHTFFDSRCDYSTGVDVDQWTQDLGAVFGYNGTEDWVAVDATSNGLNISNEIEMPDGTRRQVGGYLTETALGYTFGNRTDCEKVGITTGHTSGQIEAMHVTGDGCRTFNGEAVRVSTDAASGDSGGPVFQSRNGSEYLISMISEGWDRTSSTSSCNGADIYNGAEGISAYQVFNHSNVSPP